MGKMLGYVMAIFALDITLFLTMGSGTTSYIFGAIYLISTKSMATILLATAGTFFGVIIICMAALSVVKQVSIFGSGITLSENAGFSVLAAAIFTTCIGTFISLYQKISMIDNFCGGIAATPCQASQLFATILTGPLILGFAWACVDFARGRD
jgi:hypothetical protein